MPFGCFATSAKVRSPCPPHPKNWVPPGHIPSGHSSAGQGLVLTGPQRFLNTLWDCWGDAFQGLMQLCMSIYYMECLGSFEGKHMEGKVSGNWNMSLSKHVPACWSKGWQVSDPYHTPNKQHQTTTLTCFSLTARSDMKRHAWLTPSLQPYFIKIFLPMSDSKALKRATNMHRFVWPGAAEGWQADDQLGHCYFHLCLQVD